MELYSSFVSGRNCVQRDDFDVDSPPSVEIAQDLSASKTHAQFAMQRHLAQTFEHPGCKKDRNFRPFTPTLMLSATSTDRYLQQMTCWTHQTDALTLNLKVVRGASCHRGHLMLRLHCQSGVHSHCVVWMSADNQDLTSSRVIERSCIPFELMTCGYKRTKF